jgi:hypothetical protein
MSMPTLSLNALRKEVKAGKLASVYYFHGAEETLKEEALGALVDLAVDPASRDFNYDVRHATSLDPEALHALVNTLPMMAEKRVVVLRDVDGWTVKSPTRKVLLEYLAKPAAETLLNLVSTNGGRALDLGTGCGIFALAVAASQSGVVATDINPAALRYAAMNAGPMEATAQARSVSTSRNSTFIVAGQ